MLAEIHFVQFTLWATIFPESRQAGLSPAKEREETLLISLSCRLNPSHHQLLYGPFNAVLVCETGKVFWEALEKVFLIERHLCRKERSLFSAPPISVCVTARTDAALCDPSGATPEGKSQQVNIAKQERKEPTSFWLGLSH